MSFSKDSVKDSLGEEPWLGKDNIFSRSPNTFNINYNCSGCSNSWRHYYHEHRFSWLNRGEPVSKQPLYHVLEKKGEIKVTGDYKKDADMVYDKSIIFLYKHNKLFHELWKNKSWKSLLSLYLKRKIQIELQAERPINKGELRDFLDGYIWGLIGMSNPINHNYRENTWVSA